MTIFPGSRISGGHSRKRLRILLTEGSSTSARQTICALGRLSHRIDILDPQPLCLGRFSRYVRAWYRCPPFSSQPDAYLRFLINRLRRGRYDVLIPVHDQVYLLAYFRDKIQRHVAVALPPPAALERIQSKSALLSTLDSLCLPHPATAVAADIADLPGMAQFPCYVKLAYGTAGTGVWFAREASELGHIIAEIQRTSKSHQEILLQEPMQGVVTVSQAVFNTGRSVAMHSYQARALGVGGSARCRESVSQPIAESHLRLLGESLQWHGAIHVEYFCDRSGQPSYIDANPRIGETMNATLSGTNLCDVLVQVSLGSAGRMAASSSTGVRSHSLLTSLLALAESGASRRNLLQNVFQARFKRGLYEASEEEMSLLAQDWPSAIPLVAVLFRLFANRAAAREMVGATVANYGLTASGVDIIREFLAGAGSRAGDRVREPNGG
jgi:glutathione synthase/RimK-type ligase-like ATP-grasp enzyme